MRDFDRSALALFAEEFRAAREKAALSRDDLSSKINYSVSLVTKVEDMDRVPQADFAARCDAALASGFRLALEPAVYTDEESAFDLEG